MRVYSLLLLYCLCQYTAVNSFQTTKRTPSLPLPEGTAQSALRLSTEPSFSTTRGLSFFYNQRYVRNILVSTVRLKTENCAVQRSKDLWDAIEEEDVDLFFEILNCECVYLDEKNVDGRTALDLALRLPNEAMGLALIQAGADVNSQDNGLVTPLHLACFHHLTNATLLLLERGADVNGASADNERAIIFAQTLDDVPLLQILIRAGAEINFQDAQGETPLHEASSYGAVRNAEFLINHGANITTRDRLGNTPGELICACERFDEREAAPCFDGTCSERARRALRQLFRQAERSSNFDTGDRITVLDLWTATVSGTPEEVEEILNCDCTEAESGEQDSACICVEVQAVTQTRTSEWDEGQTALHLAVLRKHLAICRLLIENGARADFGNSDGDTPLHLATRDNSIDIVQLLLAQEISADGQNEEGQTALHIASRYGFLRIAQLLVDYGASLTLNDEQGATPLEIVCSCLLTDTCPEESCRSDNDIVRLMSALNEEDEEDHQRVVQLYFPESTSNSRFRDGGSADDDDDASSLGTFIGVLFVCAFVFSAVYAACVYVTHRREVWERKRAQLSQILNQPGPSAAAES